MFILSLSLSFCTLVNAQTQLDYNERAYAKYYEADSALNAVYQQVKAEYKEDTLFIKSLKISQRLWIKLRDADLTMRFPKEDKSFNYGSIFPFCYTNLKRESTEARTKVLMLWLKGIEEGDICSGSVKIVEME